MEPGSPAQLSTASRFIPKRSDHHQEGWGRLCCQAVQETGLVHTSWCTASPAGAACPQLPGVVPFSRGLVAPDNSWRPETKTSSYKQMLLLLEVEIFYPQSVPFSQAKTIPHRDLTPPQRNKSSPVLRVPETVCSFRQAQPRGERRWSCDFQAWRQGRPCPALFVSTGRRAFDCLTKDEADAGSRVGGFYTVRISHVWENKEMRSRSVVPKVHSDGFGRALPGPASGKTVAHSGCIYFSAVG